MKDLISKISVLSKRNPWGPILLTELASMHHPQRVIDIERRRRNAAKRLGTKIPQDEAIEFFVGLQGLKIGHLVLAPNWSSNSSFHSHGFNLKLMAEQVLASQDKLRYKVFKLSTGKTILVTPGEMGELKSLIA